MPKFANAPTALPKSPVGTVGVAPDAATAEGGAGWTRDPRSELFLLAVTNMVSEASFYESAKERDERFVGLIEKVAATDPDWVARFVPYLRNELNMRSASIVMAAELVRARLASKATNATISNRAVIGSAIARADEPAEMVGYWRSHYGRTLPRPISRGIADAVTRLYAERSYVKYGAGGGYRMADVIELVHPSPRADWQSALFRLALDERHGHATLPWDPESPYAVLATVAGNRAALALEPDSFRALFSAEFVSKNGLTWEQASARYGKLDARFWEAMIPSMGYMAALRNLRNFDEAGLTDEQVAAVADRIADPDNVAVSRQLPLRFYSAYRNTSVRWHYPLEKALNASLANVPALPGRTLILIDDSGSMDDKLSGRSDLRRRDAAAIFGAALALRAEHPSLIAYANEGVPVRVPEAGSVLPLAVATERATHGGTQTMDVLASAYDGHDRVVIVTDEQAFATARGVTDRVGGIGVPIYTFNVAGYRAGHLPSGRSNRYAFGGLTDAGFRVISLLERGRDADWPF